MCAPHIAMITTVEPVHLAGFSHVDEIASAKAEIFDGLIEGGTAVLNKDNRYYDFLSDKAQQVRAVNVLSFGTDSLASFHAKTIQVSASVTVVDAKFKDKDILFKIMAPGHHLAMNAMGAMLVCDAAGVDLAKAAMSMAAWNLPEGRGLRWKVVLDDAPTDIVLPTEEFTLVDESYNANPTSMRASFDAFALTKPSANRLGNQGRRIVMLTDMLELGEKASEMHIELANLPIIEKFDLVYVAGPLMKEFYDALPTAKQGAWFETAEMLVAEVARYIESGDAVMVKGSKGSQAFKIAAALKRLGTAKQV